jgi:hypothetical protein
MEGLTFVLDFDSTFKVYNGDKLLGEIAQMNDGWAAYRANQSNRINPHRIGTYQSAARATNALTMGLEPNCSHPVEDRHFVGHVAAPGYGTAWECGACQEPMWGMTAASATPYAELDGVPELSPDDIR